MQKKKYAYFEIQTSLFMDNFFLNDEVYKLQSYRRIV